MVYTTLLVEQLVVNVKTLFTIVFLKKKGKIKITKPFPCQDCGANLSETCEMCSCKTK